MEPASFHRKRFFLEAWSLQSTPRWSANSCEGVGTVSIRELGERWLKKKKSWLIVNNIFLRVFTTRVLNWVKRAFYASNLERIGEALIYIRWTWYEYFISKTSLQIAKLRWPQNKANTKAPSKRDSLAPLEIRNTSRRIFLRASKQIWKIFVLLVRENRASKEIWDPPMGNLGENPRREGAGQKLSGFIVEEIVKIHWIWIVW